MNAQPGFVVSS